MLQLFIDTGKNRQNRLLFSRYKGITEDVIHCNKCIQKAVMWKEKIRLVDKQNSKNDENVHRKHNPTFRLHLFLILCLNLSWLVLMAFEF